MVGRVSDRKDFYHQAKVTRSRAFSNMMPFEYSLLEFEGSPALSELVGLLAAPTQRKVHDKQAPDEAQDCLSEGHPSPEGKIQEPFSR